MSFFILCVVTLVCGGQAVRYLRVRNFHAMIGWIAALILGMSLAAVLSCVDKF